MKRRLIDSPLLPVWLKGWKGFWVLSASVYVIGYSCWIFFKWTNPANETLIANIGYIPLGLFSAIGALYVVTRRQLNPRTRRAWLFIALSYIFLSIGDIIYLVLELTRGINFPDIPDFFYLAYYPLAFIGLITIPTELSDPAQEKTWGLDLATTITSATAILWYFIIAPTAIAGGEDWVSRIVAGAYPALDILILASITSLLFRKSEINTRQSLYILGFGLMTYIIADIGYAWLVLQNLYFSGSVVDAIWTLNYFLVGLAAVRQANPYLIESEANKNHQTTWQASTMPFLAVIASVVVSFYATSFGNGTGLRTIGLLVGTTITIFITIVRQIITMRENSRLVYELNVASHQLRENANVLEEHVIERTHELEYQTNSLRLTAEIARDVASARDLESLLRRSTTLILDRFKLYHTGIFLLDKKKEYLVLVASPTKAGQQMVSEDFKLRPGDADIVAQVAKNRSPVITKDTALDTGSVNNLLPKTRSKMALPLIVENKLIGVLDVQSDKSNAFNQDDIAIMQILADQLATAIERARLLQEFEQNLTELERSYGEYTRDSWQKLGDKSQFINKGYRFDNIRIEPINKLPDLGIEAISQKNTVRSNGSGPRITIAVPIKLRGQTIGVISAKLKEGYEENTISTIELASDRLASALESARLYEEARIRADREQSISQVTSAISSSTEYEDILRTTIMEIGNVLKDTDVTIKIKNDTNDNPSGK